MTKQGTTKTHEEVIMTLPAGALDALATPLGDLNSNGHDATRGNIYMNASPVGRDEPFPCFMKSNWGNQVIIKIVQQRQKPHIA